MVDPTPMSDADVVVMTKEMAQAMICDLSRRSLKEQHLAEDARYPLRCIATGRTVVVGAAELEGLREYYAAREALTEFKRTRLGPQADGSARVLHI